ncbi:MAG TPA: DUF1566 domain-containing protein [Myxococcales bacterium]
MRGTISIISLACFALAGCGGNPLTGSEDAWTTGPSDDAGGGSAADAAVGPGVDAGGTGSSDAGACPVSCNGQCVDARRDPANCGQCGKVCGALEACVAGACQANPEWAHWPLPPDQPTQYTVAADTVTDQVTGLVWERKVTTTECTFAEARAWCDGLRLGGLTNWRLPTRIELVSILSTGNGQPFVSASAFPAYYYVASLYGSSALNAEKVWGVRYDMGWFSWMEIADAASTLGTGVRCVASTTPAPASAHYVVGSETVQDNWTGLLWDRGGSTLRRDHAEAVDYCATLDAGGFSSGWRLPTRKELESIVDTKASGELLSSDFDRDCWTSLTRQWDYWTSSPENSCSYTPGCFWSINFQDGLAEPRNADPSAGVACVRCVR